jgi:DNA modification methylase
VEEEKNKMLEINKIHQGDSIELMKLIKDKSVDLILCDLPYGTTACKWDTIIPFDKLWEQYNRVIKDNGAIVLTASQPFTSALIMSNIKMFKYCWVWDKKRHSNPLIAKKQPLNNCEDIVVFYKKQCIYNPQPYKLHTESALSNKGVGKTHISDTKGNTKITNDGRKNINNFGYPRRIIKDIPVHNNLSKDKNGLHPTQKPVALGKYLIKTYTNEGDLVLDNTCGSGSFPLSAKLENRNFIGIELDEKYCEIARQRIEQENGPFIGDKNE